MLFYKEQKIRRFGATKFIRGHSTSSVEEKTLPMDVQTSDNTSVTDENGTRTVQHLKTFSKVKMIPADQHKGVQGDMLYFQEKWFRCDSCKLSENTMLKHYTSTWTEVPESAPEQEEYSDNQ